MASKTELTKKEAAPIVAGTMPDYLRKSEGEQTLGLEGMERADLKMPRLSLCQSMTPQRQRDNPKHIAGLTEGEFFNTLTGTRFGEKLKFVPLLWYKSRILFLPIDEGGGLLCRSEDARHGEGDPGGVCQTCPKSMFLKSADGKRRPPECNLFHNYAALILPEQGLPRIDSLVMISFKSTGLDAATDLNSLMNMRGAKAAFAGVYELSSSSDTNPAGQSYYVPVVKNAGWVSEELFRIAADAYNAVRDLKTMGKLEVDPVTAEEVYHREPGEDQV